MKILTMLVLAMLAWGQLTWACSCTPEPPVSEAFSRAKVVFVGRCRSGQLITKEDDESFKYHAARYTFEAQEAFKGTAKGKDIVVETGIGFGDCGFEFKLGMSYLIYARSNNDVFETDICSRTSLVGIFPSEISSNAKDELQELNQNKR